MKPGAVHFNLLSLLQSQRAWSYHLDSRLIIEDVGDAGTLTQEVTSPDTYDGSSISIRIGHPPR
jgi:hypothetical protein